MSFKLKPGQKYIYQVVIYRLTPDPDEPGMMAERVQATRCFGTAAIARTWRTTWVNSSWGSRGDMKGVVYRIPILVDEAEAIPNSKREAIAELD